jgi:hypothetical protein
MTSGTFTPRPTAARCPCSKSSKQRYSRSFRWSRCFLLTFHNVRTATHRHTQFHRATTITALQVGLVLICLSLGEYRYRFLNQSLCGVSRTLPTVTRVALTCGAYRNQATHFRKTHTHPHTPTKNHTHPQKTTHTHKQPHIPTKTHTYPQPTHTTHTHTHPHTPTHTLSLSLFQTHA